MVRLFFFTSRAVLDIITFINVNKVVVLSSRLGSEAGKDE